MLTQSDIIEPLEIFHDSRVNSVAFSPDGSYLVAGCNDGTIQLWHVNDRKKKGAMKADGPVLVVAISSDGRWIVSGGSDCKVTVWDAKTEKRAVESTLAADENLWINMLDVSPGSTRFASASSDYAVNIWGLATGQRLVGPLKHNNHVECVAFSPDGDHVATSGLYDCLRIWDSRDGELIVKVSDVFLESLVWWHDDRIFASSWSTQRWIDAFSGSTLLELRRTSDTPTKTQLAVSRDRSLLASLEKRTLRLWDHTTYAWSPTAVSFDFDGCTIAISPDGHYFVTGGEDRISIWNLPCNNIGDVGHHQSGTFMHLSGVIMELWLRGKLESAAEVLSRDVALNSKSYHAFANRALIQARLRKWENALIDAETSINIQPSVIGCIAKSIALSGQGRHEDSMQVFDLGFSHCSAEQVNYLLLVKSVILFLAGLPHHAMARTTDLIKSSPGESSYCHAVQGYMSVLLAKSAIELHDYERAIHLLKSATYPGELSAELLTISMVWVDSTVISTNVEFTAKITGWNFDTLRFEIYQKKCEAFLAAGIASGAVTSFLEVDHGVAMNSAEAREWAQDFRRRCLDRLNELGDRAVNHAAHRDAVAYFSSALKLDPSLKDIRMKRSKAHAAIGDWELALEDADAAIEVDPSDPSCYEVRHAALHGTGRYNEAIEALNEMVVKFEQSADHHTRGLRNRYVSPSQTIAVVRSFAKQIQCSIPPVLIDVENGHLCDERERARVFEADPKFKRLVSSMVLQIDSASISQEVEEYFRYATFSHTWDGDKPDDILHESVHDLAGSPKMKLFMFCTIVREAGIRWAWSDTCCINRQDIATLQESLTSMFRWYHESSLTVVHLKGVLSDSESRTLEASLWNTRAWTLQEFFASKVIRFYTEDWKPYLPRDSTFNHKESPSIVKEMALATGVDATELLSLHPGSENVRQKLRLASTRFATKQEDIAYSMFGIFDVSIPVTYGEGQRCALGRLLQEVLTRSGDSTILAWTGKASDYNSCLPAEITVYHEPLAPHCPSTIPDDEMETVLSELERSPVLHDSAVELYDRLIFLPTPRLVSRRLSLSCIVFLLRTVSGPFAAEDDSSACVYRATASSLGRVEIRTSDNLAGSTNLVLVHPWLQSLFDPVLPHEDMIADDVETLPSRVPSMRSVVSRLSLQPYAPVRQLQLPSPLDKTTRALRLFARLRQPFGALLLAPRSAREYARVATDRPIVVRIRKEVSPHHLVDKIRVLDIL